MADTTVRPDGRWARILAALAERPLSFGALVTAVRDRTYTHTEDRTKCRRAIRGLFREGLVEGAYGRLYITDHGRTSFATILTQEQGS